MDELEQILKDRFSKLPPKLQGALINPIWRNSLGEKAQSFGLTEDQKAFLENEVVFVLMGLEPKENLVANLKSEVTMTEENARQMNDYVNGAILSSVSQELKGLGQEAGENTPAPLPKPRIRATPVDFEDAILNQAKAMRPAVAPDNLPVQKSESPKPHDYTSGQDPYREPIE